MKNLICKIACITLTATMGCGVDREAEIEKLKTSLSSYDQFRIYLVEKYEAKLSNLSRPRVVFKQCEDFEKSTEDFICNDPEVIKKMEALSIKDISFEKNECDKYSFSEVYFQVSQAGEYPVTYYLYEQCGTGEPFESKNIFYEPVDGHWGVYIDSSFP